MGSKKNTWKEKLDQLPPPSGDALWGRMEVLLDKHKPVRRNRFNRYLYLCALLLLIISVCNNPWMSTDLDNSTAPSKQQSRNATDGPPVSGMVQSKEKDFTIQLPTTTPPSKSDTSKGSNTDNTNSYSNRLKVDHEIAATIKKKGTSQGNFVERNSSSNRNSEISASKGNDDEAVKHKRTTGLIKEVLYTSSDSAERLAAATKEKTLPHYQPDSSSIETPSWTTIVAKDSRSKTKTPSLSFGIGLHHDIPINGQKPSAIDGDGGFEGWKNHLPSLYVKYSPKDKVYVLGEVEVNAPQYTTKELLTQKVSFFITPGSPPTRNRRTENVYAKKLFYFNVPLIINVSPTKNVFLGTGIQFSHLSGAILSYESKLSVNGRPDSVMSFENRSVDKNWQNVNLKENEMRWIANGNVRINRFDIGMRYTRSFGRYTEKIGAPEMRKLYNSSLSFFVRCDLATLHLKKK